MIERFLLRTALRDLVTIRRAAVAAVLVLGPACVGLVIRIGTRAEFDGVAAYGALASLLVFGFVLPILAVVFGTGAVSQEIEQRTIVYLLTRPIARWRILLVKYIAAWITISCTGLLALVVLATATYEPGKTTGAIRLESAAIRKPADLCEQLQMPETPAAEHIRARLSPQVRDALDRWDPSIPPPPWLIRQVVDGLNAVIESGKSIHDAQAFTGLHLPEDARQLLAEKPRGAQTARLNRWLLEAAFPELVAPSRSTRGQLLRDLAILPVGAAAYGAIFLLLATLFQRALIGGLFLAFGWESWVPMLPGNFKLISIMTYLRALAPHARPEAASSDIMELFQVINPEAVPSALAWTVLAATIAFALLAALVVFSIREYVPKDDSV